MRTEMFNASHTSLEVLVL